MKGQMRAREALRGVVVGSERFPLEFPITPTISLLTSTVVDNTLEEF